MFTTKQINKRNRRLIDIKVENNQKKEGLKDETENWEMKRCPPFSIPIYWVNKQEQIQVLELGVREDMEPPRIIL